MARIQKDTVNYFPHDSNACTGDTLTVLQSRYGNDGYAFWFKLLEKLASTDGHYVDCRNSTKWQLLLAKTGVNELIGVEMLNLLVEMHAIDKELWEAKIIWSQHLVDNLIDVYKNRRRELPQKPNPNGSNPLTTGRNCIICGKNIEDIRGDAKYCSTACKQKAYRVTDKGNAKNVEMGVPTNSNPITMGDNAITTGGSTQSKVKYSKVKESKVNIYSLWNEQKIITHKKLTPEIETAINVALREYSLEDILLGIKNYAEIQKGDQYYFKYAWTLKDFLKRGLSKFLDIDIARHNYAKGEEDGTHKQNIGKLTRTYTNPEELLQ